MTKQTRLSLEEKAQLIRDVKDVTFRSGADKLFTAEFISGGSALIWINGVCRIVSNPGSFLYALAGEKETFEVLLSGDKKHSPSTQYLSQIEVISPIL